DERGRLRVLLQFGVDRLCFAPERGQIGRRGQDDREAVPAELLRLVGGGGRGPHPPVAGRDRGVPSKAANRLLLMTTELILEYGVTLPVTVVASPGTSSNEDSAPASGSSVLSRS